jgi:hypothetical protein
VSCSSVFTDGIYTLSSVGVNFGEPGKRNLDVVQYFLWEGREGGKLKASDLEGLFTRPFQVLWLVRIGPFRYPAHIRAFLGVWNKSKYVNLET